MKRVVMLAALLLIVGAGCAHNRGAAPRSEPSTPAPKSTEPATPKPSASAPVEPVGAFSRIEQTGSHAYGQSVELWKSEGRLLGLLLIYVGPEGDPPTGLLEDVVYSASTGDLSFRARLTLGNSGGTRQSASRDNFVFHGTLREKSLSGIFEISDRAHPDVPARREVVSLSLDANTPLDSAKSVAEWRKGADEILATRGPKW